MKLIKEYLSKFPLIRHHLITVFNFLKSIKIIQKMFRDRNVDYSQWIEKTALTSFDVRSIKNEVMRIKKKPTMSIIMPVYNVDPKWLEKAINSIIKQIYPNWELCLVDDGSTHIDTIEYFSVIDHPRIKKKKLRKNEGIAFASNVAIGMASGEYLVLMDHDDVLTVDALFECVKVINDLDPDLIYSDEDRIGNNGVRNKPFFKPAWSLELLRSQNYICHLAVIKKEAMEIVGGFNSGFEGAQDYDLFLRISEITKKIHHIPKVLYSWREIETSTNINPDAKPMAQKSGLKAVDMHLKRVYGDKAYAKESDNLFVYDSKYRLSSETLISIIIPTKDQVTYLERCIESILKKTKQANYEIIIINNNSIKKETISFLSKVTDKYSQVTVIEAHYPFNWSKLNNQGMEKAKGDVYIFLNNDTQVISEDWMERLASQALRDNIGAVGGLLLYEDETIQHAGVVVGMGGWADHVFKGMPPNHHMENFVSPMVKRNVLAVTGSCLAVSKRTIESIGLFNEDFIVCGSDVELCLRAYQNGLKNIYDPLIRLYHYESKTRIPDNIPESDFDLSKKHYQKYWNDGDPYYNPNLSMMNTTPTLSTRKNVAH